jgi:hypothetical protein
MDDLFESDTAVLGPKEAIERMANLFYDKRKDEAFKAAEMVLKESEGLYSRMKDPSEFIDLVITSGYIGMLNKGVKRIPKTEQQFQVQQDIAKFLDYFRRERGRDIYIKEQLH